MKKGITPKSKDFSKWYLDIIEQADLAENSVVRGSMIIKPHGFSIWERFKEVLDRMFKDTGHKNAYFPLFIPKSFLSKEAKHVDGFAKETAVVTHHRLRTNPKTQEIEVDPEAKLEEELIVRPTSETIIYDSFSRWVKSYRDLPILINQWANVVRWELRTKPFLRTAEFLWQEGHTAHATKAEAEAEARQMLSVYETFAKEYLAMPVIPGEKSESEKFAGAFKTYTIEAMMQDGKALQAATSHNLGDNFAKAFEIQFTDMDGEVKHAWTTSWGLSTRMLGGMIMVHSDDNGLVIPPKISPIHGVIIPIWKSNEEKDEIFSYCNEIKKELENEFAIEFDMRDHISPGWKFNEWEKKGIPIRIEAGPKDLSKRSVVIVRRDTGKKSFVDFKDIHTFVKNELENMHNDMYQKALKFRDEHVVKVETYDELKDAVNNGKFALAHWDGTEETESKIQEETKATIRCIPFDSKEEEGKCVYSGEKSSRRVIFAKAY